MLLLPSEPAAARRPGPQIGRRKNGVPSREHAPLTGPSPAPSLPRLPQAGLLCVLEEQLYGGDHEDITHNVHTMYPAFIVAATSGGCLLRLLRLTAVLELAACHGQRRTERERQEGG